MAIGNEAAAVILAGDSASLDALRLKAKTDPAGAARQAARQFEALLMGVMLKSMRETVSRDGLFDSEQARLYTSLLDQQLAQSLAARGIGLTEVIERQLSATMPAAAPAGRQPGTPTAAAGADARALEFVQRHAGDARTASRESGIPARLLLAQAALESGWGTAEIRAADGTPSHNLFGIKAGASWQGRTAEASTTEYAAGAAQQKLQSFRAYDSYLDAFRDHAALISGQARYAAAMQGRRDAHAYARGLQQGGYATDPRYAEKLADVAGSPALRALDPA